MYADKWHLTFNLEHDPLSPKDDLLYLFAYAYRPNTTRADCTNRWRHGNPNLKNGRLIKPDEAMHEGTRAYF